MPGPAASPFARRSNPRPDWKRLPPGGYRGAVPDWPFDADLEASEPLNAKLREVWLSVWRTPQAAVWVTEGYSRVVARYVEMLALYELNGGKAADLGELRQLEDRLGLSPMAMKRLQWEIGDGPASSAAASGHNATVVSIEDRRDF